MTEAPDGQTDIPRPEAPERGTSDALATAIGYTIVLGPLFYWLVWQKVPLQPLYKVLILVAMAAVGAAIALALATKRNPQYEKLRNSVLVLVIIPGAALFSLYFGQAEQVVFFKVVAVVYLAFLPPWLYLQFMNNRGSVLWEEFVMNLHRLAIDVPSALPEPPRASPFHARWVNERAERRLPPEPDEPTLYQRKFEGVFGPVRTDRPGAIRGENMWPVALAALLLSLGWVLVLQPDSVFGFEFLRLISSDFAPSDRPAVPLDMLRFGFIGAYFYVLQMLVRRYFQNDLKTSAYVSAIQRIVTVMLLVWVVDLVLPTAISPGNRLAAAFLIGVFPDMGIQLIVALIKLPLKAVLPSLRKKYPLSDLDGLNPWYESRLLEEGVEDMQNLATANLVDVMLNTNVPVDRLVDWVDQSILFLHLGGEAEGQADDRRRRLRSIGVRTATDLEDLFGSPDEDYRKSLDRHLSSPDDGPSVLRSILLSFRREPNLYHVDAWRSHPWSVAELPLAPTADVDAATPVTPEPRIPTPAGGG